MGEIEIGGRIIAEIGGLCNFLEIGIVTGQPHMPYCSLKEGCELCDGEKCLFILILKQLKDGVESTTHR